MALNLEFGKVTGEDLEFKTIFDEAWISSLDDQERKLQECIHELVSQEEKHTRRLKLLRFEVYQKMLASKSLKSLAREVFATLESLFIFHLLFCRSLQTCRDPKTQLCDASKVADLLTEKFDKNLSNMETEIHAYDVAEFTQKVCNEKRLEKKANSNKELKKILDDVQAHPLGDKGDFNSLASNQYQLATKYKELSEKMAKYCSDEKDKAKFTDVCEGAHKFASTVDAVVKPSSRKPSIASNRSARKGGKK